MSNGVKRNINLLPPDQQNQLRLEGKNSDIQRFGFWLLLSLVLMAGVLWVGKLYFVGKLQLTAEQLTASNRQLIRLQETMVQKQVETLNRDLANFQLLESQNLKWSPYLIELASLLPTDMTVDTLVINRLSGRVDITGRAASRESVLKFRENLLASEYFQNVNFPLYNLETAKNVNWKFRFYLKNDSF